MIRRLFLIPVATYLLLCNGGIGSAGENHANEQVREILQSLREEHKLPAMAAAVIVDGKLIAAEAVGTCQYGGSEPVTIHDAFHMGSCTKAMTATLIGLLIERGRLDWDTTLAEALPELARSMHPKYRDVTIRHLIAHRAGLPRSAPPGKKLGEVLAGIRGDSPVKRRGFAQIMLSEKPAYEPGTRYLYSNAGYMILGTIAARAGGARWERLMDALIFRPLRMSTAGFGAMPRVSQHRRRSADGPVTVGKPKPERTRVCGPVGPAGEAHCSVVDWAKFVLAHLQAAHGQTRFLKAETTTALHQPALGGQYAGGWLIVRRNWAEGPIFHHTGANGNNFAVVWAAVKPKSAVLVVTNIGGGGQASQACDQAAGALVKTFIE